MLAKLNRVKHPFASKRLPLSLHALRYEESIFCELELVFREWDFLWNCQFYY